MAQKRKPQYRANEGSSEQLPRGAAQALNEVEIDDSELMPAWEEQAPGEVDYEPDTNYEGDMTGLDHKIFGRTDRPGEPVTTGAPFGDGPDVIRWRNESEREFRMRVAKEIANSPLASKRTKAWAARLSRGE